MVGCSSKKKDLFEVVKYDSVKKNRNFNVHFSFEAEVDIPTKEFGNSYKLLRDNIVSAMFGSEFVDYSNEKALRVYADSLNAEHLRFYEENDAYIKEELEPTSIVNKLSGWEIYTDSSYVSYMRKMKYESECGDMGTGTIAYRCYVFDTKTGERLTEEDLFGKDYKRKLHKLLVKYATPLRNDTILPAEEDDLYNNELIQPNGNFMLNDSVVTYIFHKYEIAYGVFGDIFIEIPRSEIEFEN